MKWTKQEMTCHMLFMCARTPHLEGSTLEQCQKLMVSRIKQIPSVSFERGGRGWKSLYFTWPGTSILIPFDCGPTPLGAYDLSCVAACMCVIEILFWILSVHICADSCSCTEQLFQLAWVAINRGLTPVARHLLAGAHPNLLSSKCNVINLSHTHNNQTLSLINTIRMSSNSTHCFSQRNDRNQCAQLST